MSSSKFCGDATEPIAVVGMAMRFPGGSHSAEQFWDMLSKGRSAHAPIPKERFNAEGYYHPDGARAGAINIKGAYFLKDDASAFDAPFFSMTMKEANGTDAQQRLMLEVAYETFENAGIPVTQVAGSDTSVYVGCFTKDWEATGGRDPYGGPFYAATGNGQSMLSSRISWFFDMRGPSMTIDTACSSSLYAVHMAVQSLRLGESKMVLVGGTNLICDPAYMRDMCAMTFFSPDGVCHSFDHRANGYARGDGIGGICLKTLSQALADGDTIRAVLRNSGLNQDGKTPGITMPSPQMQAELIRTTYAAAKLSMDQTAYFEAHGTGTSIGDPYELSALGATFGATRDPTNPIYAGSVKTNIGHLEGCAGLAGLIKTVLCVERGQIPPLAGFEKANPKLKLAEWKVALPEVLTPWPMRGLRRASVNSFGYGGANAHVIVDDAYHYLQEHGLKGNHMTTITESSELDEDSGFSSISTPNSDEVEVRRKTQKLLVFSSSDQAGLGRVAEIYANFVNEKLTAEKQVDDTDFVYWPTFTSDLAYTLGSRRSALDHRTFIVARSASDLTTQLAAPLPRFRRVAKNNNTIFVFTGQGAQWPAMGKELMSHKVYRESLKKADATLEKLGCPWSATEELFAAKETSHIDAPDFSQPLCTALQLALVDLLKTWGITPKSVVGHSSGEIGAAYAAGLISYENAMKVAYLRGIFSADVNRRQPNVKGAMLAVGLSEEAVRPYLSKVAFEAVVVACVNAPGSVTLSGNEDAIEFLKELINKDGVFARKLRVQTAYHSPHMRIIAEDYLNSMGDLVMHEGEPTTGVPTTGVTMFSSVTMAPITAKDLDASYWVKNMLNTVRFSEAVKLLVTQKAEGKGRRKVAVAYSAMIECGPADALKGPLNQILTATDERLVASIPYTSMLTRGANAEITALSAAGKLWGAGINVDLKAVNFQDKSNENHKSLANLPPYPWNHSKTYGHESAWGKKYRFLEKPRTDLLGLRLENQDPEEPRWHNYIRLGEQPWMADHKVQGLVIYPGAGMITMAIEAARELIDETKVFKAIEARNVIFMKGLVVPTVDNFVETAMHLRPSKVQVPNKVSYDFKMFSQEGKCPWAENCTGSVTIIYEGEENTEEVDSWKSRAELYGDIKKRATKTISSAAFYKLFDKKMNLQYGPLHQNVTEAIAGKGEGHGVLTIPDTKAAMPSQYEYPHLIHPSTLDSIFHMQALGYLHTLTGEESLIPISIESIYVAADVPVTPGEKLTGYSKGTQSSSGDCIGDIVLSTGEWVSPKVIVKGFLSKDMSAGSPARGAQDTRASKCTNMQWIELTSTIQEPKPIDDDEEVEIVEDNEVAEIVLLYGCEASKAVRRLADKLSMELSSATCNISTAVFEDLEEGGKLDFTGKTVISLCEAEEPAIAKWTEETFLQFKLLTSQTESLLWITRGGEFLTEKDLSFSTSTGLLRTVRVERLQLKLPHLDLSPSSDISSDETVEHILTAFKASILSSAAAVEQEFSERNGKLWVPRLLTQESFHAELGRKIGQVVATQQELGSVGVPLKASFTNNGKSLVWSHDEEYKAIIGHFDVEILVSAVCLDSGDLAHTKGLGHDAVGIITSFGAGVLEYKVGDQVVICAFDSLRTHIRVNKDFVRRIPDFMSPVLAVAMPSALSAAFAALVDSARLQIGDTILINSTAGTFEQAAILLAQGTGAEVFAAATTRAHKTQLLELGVAEDHILNSARGAAFSKALKHCTKDRGVDVVVNTLVGAHAEESVRCLADFGRFINAGNNQVLPAIDTAAYNITCANVNLKHMGRLAGAKLAKIFAQSWDRARRGFSGQIAPKRTFTVIDTEKALAYLGDEECGGSAVLTLSPTDVVSVLHPKPAELALNPEATYVLSGGLGGIGRSIADMMFAAGARSISFLSRSGAKSTEAQQLLSSLQERGCNAQAYCCDVADTQAVENFVNESLARGEKIAGVIQAAMVLRDSMFDNMTFEQWTQATRPKIQGTLNLSNAFPKDMDFFIMLSSMAGVIGNPGQANYSAAGTFQDALSVYRRANGLASTTVDLGIVSDVGYISENADQFERLAYLENLFISERDLHAILSAAMLGQTRDGEAVPAQLVTGVGKELLADGSIGMAMTADLKYIHLQEGDANANVGDASEDDAIKAALKAADSLREACKIVEGVIINQLAKSLAMEGSDIDLEKPMHAYGVDSLAAIEVRNIIFRKVKADISVFDILSTLPLVKLAVRIVSKSRLAKTEVSMAAQEESAE